ncbi:MAG: zinc-ribbon domain-containing protein [Acholeplasmatales bacterium]|nr:zinc-ribbon domain-containing protein [Acholeplasmatales bacterium]
MYCVNCGFKLDDSYNYCPECGTRINKSFVTITDVNPMLATMVMMSVAGRSMNLFFLNGNFYKDKNCTMLFPLNNITNNNSNNDK